MALQASDIPGINATRLGFCSTEQLLTAYNAIPDDIWQQLTEGYLPVQVNPTDRREPYILAVDSKLLFIIDQENNNIILREKAILIRALVLTPTPPKIAILCDLTGVSRLLRIGIAALTNIGLPLSSFFCIADRTTDYFEARHYTSPHPHSGYMTSTQPSTVMGGCLVYR